MITFTLEELKERLKRYDEVTILELLDINTEEIIERFEDKSEERFDKLSEDEDL